MHKGNINIHMQIYSTLVLFVNECFYESVGDEECGGEWEVGDRAGTSSLAQPPGNGRTLICITVLCNHWVPHHLLRNSTTEFSYSQLVRVESDCPQRSCHSLC